MSTSVITSYHKLIVHTPSILVKVSRDSSLRSQRHHRYSPLFCQYSTTIPHLDNSCSMPSALLSVTQHSTDSDKKYDYYVIRSDD